MNSKTRQLMIPSKPRMHVSIWWRLSWRLRSTLTQTMLGAFFYFWNSRFDRILGIIGKTNTIIPNINSLGSELNWAINGKVMDRHDKANMSRAETPPLSCVNQMVLTIHTSQCSLSALKAFRKVLYPGLLLTFKYGGCQNNLLCSRKWYIPTHIWYRYKKYLH